MRQLRKLGIALIPWSPLGGGFLTGTINAVGADDFRNNNPRYQGDNLAANKQRFALLMKLAEERGIAAARHLVHMPSHIYMRVGRFADSY